MHCTVHRNFQYRGYTVHTVHIWECYEGMKTVQTLLSMMRNLILVAEQPYK